MAEFHCECAIAGYCAKFKREMHEVHWQTCRGERLTPEKCAGYRKNWLRLSGAKEMVRSHPCINLGDELRRESCLTCKGSVRVKIFACSEHGEATVSKKFKGISVCSVCPQYHPAKE